MLTSIVVSIVMALIKVAKHVLVVSFTMVCMLGAILVSELILDRYFNN